MTDNDITKTLKDGLERVSADGGRSVMGTLFSDSGDSPRMKARETMKIDTSQHDRWVADQRGFSTEKPDTIGLYQMFCSENNNIADHVAICKVDDPDLRAFSEHYTGPLTPLHEGLCNVQWKKIA